MRADDEEEGADCGAEQDEGYCHDALTELHQSAT
jgi:hypothetical protein